MAKDKPERSPFTRVSFLVGAALVAVIIVTAVVLAFSNLGRGNDDAPPTVPSDAPRPSVSGAIWPPSTSVSPSSLRDRGAL